MPGYVGAHIYVFIHDTIIYVLILGQTSIIQEDEEGRPRCNTKVYIIMRLIGDGEPRPR